MKINKENPSFQNKPLRPCVTPLLGTVRSQQVRVAARAKHCPLCGRTHKGGGDVIMYVRRRRRALPALHTRCHLQLAGHMTVKSHTLPSLFFVCALAAVKQHREQRQKKMKNARPTYQSEWRQECVCVCACVSSNSLELSETNLWRKIFFKCHLCNAGHTF